MKFMNAVVVTVFSSALATVTGCATDVEEAANPVDPALINAANDADNVDAKYSVEGGSCTTPYSGFKGHIWGYYGYSIYPVKSFGPAPTGTECANWCKSTCGYTGIPTLATFPVNSYYGTWRCGCR